MDFIDGQVRLSCGAQIEEGPTGSYFIQWFPSSTPDNSAVIKYTIYAKAGSDTVTKSNYDHIWYVDSTTLFFLTPNLGPTTCWSFIVSASNRCGESSASEVFNTLCLT